MEEKKKRLREIEKRLENTTYGEWKLSPSSAEDDDLVIENALGVYICQMSYDCISTTMKHKVNEDAEFIAHAKSDIRFLIDILRQND